VVEFRQRVEETCELARNKLPKVQTRNQNFPNKKAREQKLNVGNIDKLCLSSELILKLEGCLLQMHGVVKHPGLYASRKLIPRKQICSAVDMGPAATRLNEAILSYSTSRIRLRSSGLCKSWWWTLVDFVFVITVNVS